MLNRLPLFFYYIIRQVKLSNVITDLNKMLSIVIKSHNKKITTFYTKT